MSVVLMYLKFIKYHYFLSLYKMLLTNSVADGGGFRALPYQPHKYFYKYKKLSVTHNPPLVSNTKLWAVLLFYVY